MIGLGSQWFSTAERANALSTFINQVRPYVQSSERIRRIKIWMQTPGNTIPLNRLIREILPLIEQYDKSSIVALWFKTHEGAIDLATVINVILPLFGPGDKTKIISAWLKTKGNTLPLSRLIKEVFPLFNEQENYFILEPWLECPENQEANNLISQIIGSLQSTTYATQPAASDDIKTILGLLQDDEERANYIAAWLRNPANDVSENILLKIITALEGTIRVRPDLIPSVLEDCMVKTDGVDRLLTVLPRYSLNTINNMQLNGG